ncbi:MAG: hypothetical protein JSW30_02445 [Dehalococcoidia bacterium]|nr:MAG: hypothetical protein JSW30_02445 [Dehalococcoidia bacterium]
MFKIKRSHSLLLVVLCISLAGLLGLTACTVPARPPEQGPSPFDRPGFPTPPSPIPPPQPSYLLPTNEGEWVPPKSHVGRKPTDTGKVNIEGIGDFTFNSEQVETLRPDIFRPGHFSIFDALAHLDGRGDIEMDYHYDSHMNTHFIDAIDGEPNWWYQVKYSGGWFESNAFRMDMYPYKNNTEIKVYRQDENYLARICGTFRAEAMRLTQNGGQVIIPEVTISTFSGRTTFTNVVVTAHNVRSDVLQPDMITALDVLLSLGEQGQLNQLKLTWYERIGDADPVDSYWVEQIDVHEAYNGCGFVYEAGAEEFSFQGNHIHVPLDVRIIISPEYALWYWICL